MVSRTESRLSLSALRILIAFFVGIICLSVCTSIAYADGAEKDDLAIQPAKETIEPASEETETVSNETAQAQIAPATSVEVASITAQEVVPEQVQEKAAVVEQQKPVNKPTKAGWMKDADGTWYYFAKANAKPSTGWVKSGGKWYWLQPDKNGAMAESLWVTDKGKKYYLDYKGVMCVGWFKPAASWYYANSSGAQVNGWVKSAGKWYWLQSDNGGAMAESKWVTDKGKKYYLDYKGVMCVGWFKPAASWYYANSSGAQVNGWVKSAGKWYWLQKEKDGAMVTNALLDISGKKYSFTSEGAMQIRCQVNMGNHNVGYAASSGEVYQIGVCKDNKLFLMSADGKPLTGWQKLAGYWFYGGSNGEARIGWFKDGPHWYYTDNSGAMVTGSKIIDGKINVFTVNGRWIGATKFAQRLGGYSSNSGYLVLVDRGNHIVGLYKGRTGNWTLDSTFACVVGKPSTPTPTGSFLTSGSRRMTLSTDARAHYCTHISSGYFFHTTLNSEAELGHSLSHGCIRLPTSQAIWMYNNLPGGTRVVIYN